MMIRLLALLALLWTGKQVVKQVSATMHGRDGSESGNAPEVVDDMVKDPVCATFIPKSLAHHQQHDGHDYYFCSEECAKKFLDAQTSSSAT